MVRARIELGSGRQHQRQSRDREALRIVDQKFAVAGAEAFLYIRALQQAKRAKDQVALVFAILVVNNDYCLARSDITERAGDWVQSNSATGGLDGWLICIRLSSGLFRLLIVGTAEFICRDHLSVPSSSSR